MPNRPHTRLSKEEVGPLNPIPLEGLLVLAAFFGLFFGYALGRRQGKREGFREGFRYAPLEMRRLTWERGHCVICGSEGSDADGDSLAGGVEAPWSEAQ